MTVNEYIGGNGYFANAKLTQTFTVGYLSFVGFVLTQQTKSSEFILFLISFASYFYIMMHISP